MLKKNSAISRPHRELKRVSSGIPGLDDILSGGFLEARVYSIEGHPGDGKTILANQVCFEHVKGGGQVVYLTLLAESHGLMVENLSTLGFFDPACVSRSIHYISGYPVLEEKGLDGILELVAELQKKYRATLFVIDGFSQARNFAESEIQYRKFVQKACAFFQLARSTCLLLSSLFGISPHSEHAVVDGLIELSSARIGMRSVRELEVHKGRGSDHMAGRHPFDITPEGLVIYPRLEQLFSGGISGEDLSNNRQSFNSKKLNAMFGGGLPSGSGTILYGPSGAGKTMLGLDFLSAGAGQGEVGLHFGFYESPERLVAMGDRAGLKLGRYVKSGMVEILWQSPFENMLDALAPKLLKAVAERKVKRLVIDSLDAMKASSVYPDRFGRFIAALTTRLRSMGVTTLISEEMDLFSTDIKAPLADMSAIIENVILLKYVEVDTRLRRAISIIKIRGSHYDSSIRELLISEKGVEVANTFAGLEGILSGNAHPVASVLSQK